MKLFSKFSLFSFNLLVARKFHYEFSLHQDGDDDDGWYSPDKSMFYRVTYYRAWRQARSFAKFDGVSTSFMIHKVTYGSGSRAVELRIIPVKKKVSFFSK